MNLRLTPLTILLLLSLLLNGVFLGMAIADRAFEPPHRGHRGSPDREFSVRLFLHNTPEPQREAMREELRERLDDVRPLFERARQAHRAAFEALAADPFDRAEAEAALQELRAARLAIDEKAQAVMLDLVEDLDAQTRRQALEAGMDRRIRHHRRSPPDQE